MTEDLQAHLFPGDGQNTYAILDGASCEDLLTKLAEFGPESICLYAGELDAEVREVAPYLVELLPGHPFAEWLLAEGPGKHWGVFVQSTAELRAMRKHLRTLLLVKSPQGQTLYFRYYDPRVLSIFLPTAEKPELDAVFGPATYFFAEKADEGMVRFGRDGDGLAQTPLRRTVLA